MHFSVQVMWVPASTFCGPPPWFMETWRLLWIAWIPESHCLSLFFLGRSGQFFQGESTIWLWQEATGRFWSGTYGYNQGQSLEEKESHTPVRRKAKEKSNRIHAASPGLFLHLWNSRSSFSNSLTQRMQRYHRSENETPSRRAVFPVWSSTM